ncbi:MAG: HAMP domain-containing sensor histidine kinase, partial [Candidatus Cloacimonadaceae bacterium]|nr:HAMP domain-containing sensor histidine kinase [Candidatus Cloacimonadaceae bacterium]
MKQASKNSTPSGTSRKNTNRFQTLRLYLIFGSLVIFGFFAVYTQILIQNAKREQEFVPRIFAKYIAYTDSYLRQAEQYSKLLGEISSNYIQFATNRNFQQALWDYVSTEFMLKNPIPVIITDEFREPLIWNKVGVSQDSTFADLSEASQKTMQDLMANMTESPLIEEGNLTGFAYYAKPVSLEQFIRKIDYSVVVTDRQKKPLFWRNVEINEVDSYEQMNDADRNILQEKIASMSEIPISNDADSLGYIYFSAPKTLTQIRFFIFFGLLIAVILILFGSYGLLLLRQTEKDTLWIGLAKETAHQFGTPITSLMGWIDYLKQCPTDSDKSPNMDAIINHMTTDLNHLKNIASRFGKVGSQTKLLPVDLHQLLTEIVEYFRQRLPHLGSRIDIHLISKIEGINVMLDVELFKWTLENLIKNCVDAMTKGGGHIIITATRKDKWIYLQVRDEGKGIPRSQWKKIFEPGVTTKTRGWGLGLSLAKRIIEEYHQGH